MIVDTPGIFDTAISNEHTQEEIFRSVALTSPGPHAFVLVLNVARYTDEEHKSIEHFVKYFGENIYNYSIVLFTRKDDLDDEGKTLLDHLESCPPELKMLIQKCGGRVIAFNNRLKGEEQYEQTYSLLNMINNNIQINGGTCYTNEMYIEAEKLMKQKEEEINRKLQEDRKRDLKRIEVEFAKKYEWKYLEQKEKHENTQRQLREIKEKHSVKQMQVIDLKDSVCRLEKQMNDSKRTEREKYQQTLDLLNSDLIQVQNETRKKEREIERLKEKNRIVEQRQTDLLKRKDQEMCEWKKGVNEMYEEKIDRIRDEIRENVVQNEGFFCSIYNGAKSFFSKLLPW